MMRLRQTALENGITQFVAEVLPGNLSMLRLLREAGPTTSHYSQGEVEVYVDLSGQAQAGEPVQK